MYYIPVENTPISGDCGFPHSPTQRITRNTCITIHKTPIYRNPVNPPRTRRRPTRNKYLQFVSCMRPVTKRLPILSRLVGH